MDIFKIFELMGGLGMFLYGMKIMGNYLEKCAGGKLEKILESLTSNKFKSILLGLGVTAVIQSSGAVTVMLVGFVNSGIMQLEQTVGVIMGSNIGTTVTAWILSLSGIQGTSVIMQMLKPENFSPILIFVGTLMALFFKKETVNNVGRIILGFGLLMFGMSVMSSSMKPLAESERFCSILTLFSNPIFGVIAGLLLTTILQSSSASVGVVQALSATGAITFGAAVPILTGQNIGSCTTSLISAIGASTGAKRTACVHLFFNIIGTVLFLSVFYLLNAIFKFSFIDDSINGFNIAVIHTTFNVLATIVMLPFTKQLTHLAEMVVRDKEGAEDKDNEDIMVIDDRFLNTPAFAIEQCKVAANKMADLVFDNVSNALALLHDYHSDAYKEVVRIEDMIDRYEDTLGAFLAKISAHKPSEQTTKTVTLLLHTIGDMERIGDHAQNVADNAKLIHKNNIAFSEKAQKEISTLQQLLEDTMAATFTAFSTNDREMAKRIEPMEEAMDDLCVELKNRHVNRIQNGKCTIRTGVTFLDMLNDFERISDHCSNLAAYIVQEDNETYEVHEYIKDLKKNDTDNFRLHYLELLDKYVLPESSSSSRISKKKK